MTESEKQELLHPNQRKVLGNVPQSLLLRTKTMSSLPLLSQRLTSPFRICPWLQGAIFFLTVKSHYAKGKRDDMCLLSPS